jgi:hypothetical protein
VTSGLSNRALMNGVMKFALVHAEDLKQIQLPDVSDDNRAAQEVENVRSNKHYGGDLCWAPGCSIQRGKN